MPGQRPISWGNPPFDPNAGDLSGSRAPDSDMYAREVFGVADWATLAADVRAKSKVLADDAAYELTNIAQWYHLDDAEFTGVETSDLQREFNELWRVMWITKGIRMFRDSDKAIAYEKNIVAPALQRAVDFLNQKTDFLADIDSFTDDISLEKMMKSVLGIVVRQRTPVIPPVNEAARTIREEFVKLWESDRWNFRVRHTSMTINTDGSVDFGTEGDIDQFDGFASKYMIVLDANSIRSRIVWLDSTRFAEAKAYFDNRSVSTGVPRFFFTEDRGSSTIIHWAPDPGATYTAYANILIKAPSFSTDQTDDAPTNGLNSLPQPLRAHLRDIVSAKLLSKWGREDVDAKRNLDMIAKDRAELIDDWTERGAEASSPVPRAGYNMIKEQSSYRGGSPIIGQF